MRKELLIVTAFIAVAGFTVLSCNKKKSSGITPTYGTTGNPNPINNTVTGNTTYTNPATENTSMYVGGSGWNNPTCGTTNSIALRASNGSIDVTLNFNSTIISGTYAIASSAAPNVCAMTVVNAPNQPSGIVWRGKSGSVVVSSTAASINANLINIICTQETFNFPVVSVSGFMSCGQ